MDIRPATSEDDDAIWRLLQPVFRAGETYPIPRDITRAEALAYWHTSGHHVFVTEDMGGVVGTYFLRANQRGGGGHVANCGYVVADEQTQKGVARAMCVHSIEQAKQLGFRAMQFNFVVSTNSRAVKLWQSMGFAIAGTLPHAFHHPTRGHVDAYVMFRDLA
jgi:L-amino acid N-acyltransferase YncA